MRQIGLEDSMGESCHAVNFSCASWRTLTLFAVGFPAMPCCCDIVRFRTVGVMVEGIFWKGLLAVYEGGVDRYENHLCEDVGTFSRRVVVRSLC